MCYVYRISACEKITDEISDLANTLLKKISAIRTILFLDFYEQNLKKELTSEIENCKLIVKNLAKDSKVKEKFAEAGFLNREKKFKSLYYFDFYQN